MRTSVLSDWLLPTREISPSCSTRRIFVCVVSGMSPISSRKSVPPSHCSNLPMRCDIAPVKAPFSWPKSSLSSRFSGMAAQLMARNGLFTRVLFWKIARATSSLPVPLSPVMRMVVCVGATWPMSLYTCCIAGELPTMAWRESSALALAGNGAASVRMACATPSASASRLLRCGMSKGLRT